MSQWYRLDNAGQIFPSSSTRKRMNNFRLSMTLKETVDPLILSEAVNSVMPRFSALNVKLRHGIFWYYLEKNNNQVKVCEETPYILSTINRRENNGFLFRLSHFEKRITLEVFHALTDGYGAMQFLKSIVFNYLRLQGKEIDSKGIASDYEERIEEIQDSFIKNYDKTIKTNYKDRKALLVEGTSYEEDWIALINGTVDASKVKEISKKYNATVTEFLVSVIFQSVIKTKEIIQKKNLPFQIFIPINLRRIFPSFTLRNFSLYVTTKVDIYKEPSFEEIIETVKASMKEELNKDKIKARIVANVKIEKNFFLRIVPLFIKSLVLKIGYNSVAGCANSFTISNLGVVDMPKDMMQYVERVNFLNIGSSKTPINAAVVTYNNELNISFTSFIIERDIQKEFFRLLAAYGLDVTIQTNEVEVLK